MAVSETDMVTALKSVKDDTVNELLSNNMDYGFALHECCVKKYVDGLRSDMTANGNYVFQIMDGYGITQNGEEFLLKHSNQ